MPNAPKPKVVTRKHLARLEREKRQRRYIYIGTAIVILIVVGSIVYGLLDANIFQYNQAVASVGSQVITVRDFQNAVRFQRFQLIQQYDQYLQFYQQFQGDPFGIGPQLDSLASSITDTTALGSNTVDRLVEDIVIANESAKRGIVVTDADVEKAYEAVFGYFPNGTPTPTTTPTEYLTPTMDATQQALITITPTPTAAPTGTATPTETPTVITPTATVTGPTPTTEPPTATPSITPTATPYTQQGFQNVASTYVANLKPINVDETYIRKLLRAQLLREKLTEAIGNEVATSQDQVWVRHILVADQATANTVETRLKNNEDFGKLAAELSTDTATKDSGGDLGWFAKGLQDPAIDTAAFALKVGEISQPVQTAAGWQVLQLLGHEVRPLTADQLATARSTAFTTWLNTQTSAKDVVKNETVWSAKVPTDPVFTPVVIPTQAPQPAIPTASTPEPTTAGTPQPTVPAPTPTP